MNPAALVRGPATINVDLPPAALAAPAAGVASALSKRLLRWCPDLGGVLLSYGSVELLGSHSGKREGKNSKGEGAEEGGNNSAEISDYFGFVRVAAAVGDALVFAPCPGMRLEGTVARVGGDYVGVLALGVFSAAVGGAALSGRFDLEDVEVEEEEAVEEEVEAAAAAAAADEAATKTSKTSKKKKTVTTTKKAWVCRADRSHRLVEGARVLFDVARVRRSDGGFVSITGTLESGSSGVVGARGVGAAAASPAPASASAPAAKKSKSAKSGIPSTAPTPASAAANGSSKRKKAEAGSAEKKKEPKKKEKEKEPEAKKAKTSSKKK